VREDDLYRANPEETALLAYYANAIAPLAGVSGVKAGTTAPAAADAVQDTAGASPSLV
jgi:hypothetical protein